MKISKPFAFAVMLAVLLLPHSSMGILAGRQEPDFDDLDRVALAEMKEMVIPGAVVAVVSGDRVTHMKAFGISNIETRISPEIRPMDKSVNVPNFGRKNGYRQFSMRFQCTKRL